MKRVLGFAFTLLILFSITACDKMDCQYSDPRMCDPNFVPPKDAEIIQYTADLTGYTQKAMIEDYTGFRCVNCPPATVTAEQLKADHPGQVFVLAVHALDVFSAPIDNPEHPNYFQLDFRTDAGKAWATDFGVIFQGIPNGMVNRRIFSGASPLVSYASWEISVNTILSESPKVFIKFIDVSFDSDSSNVTADIVVKPLENVTENYSFTLCLMGSNIIEAQEYPNDSISYPYSFQDVLRETVNGSYGQQSLKPELELKGDEALLYTYTIKLKNSDGTSALNTRGLPLMFPGTSVNDLSLIGFVSKETSRQILQAEEYDFGE